MTYSQYARMGLHISASWRDVVRASAKKFKRSAFKTQHRAGRHSLYRDMLGEHAKAQALYHYVVTGTFGT